MGLSVAAAAIILATSPAPERGGAPPGAIPPAASAGFTEATGVEIVRVAVTAGGGMLDLRYRVLNPDKAAVVHDADHPPAVIHEPTGTSVDRPWMPHHGSKAMHMAVIYYELLINPGGVVKRGDAVTVAIGGARLPHVIVQ